MNSPTRLSPVAVSLLAVIDLLTTSGGTPVSGEIVTDVLEDVPSKATILEAIGVEERPFELFEAFKVLEEIEQRLDGITSPGEGLTAFKVVVTCRNLIRAIGNKGKNPWDPKEQVQAAGPVVDLAKRAKKDAERTAEKAYRAALVARLVELKAVHNPNNSTPKLEAAVTEAGGKLPRRPKPGEVTKTEPVQIAPVSVPAPTPVVAKPAERSVSPERATLLAEVAHFGVALERPVTEYSNTELRFNLRKAVGAHKQRVARLQSEWGQIMELYAKLHRDPLPFPVTEKSSAAEVTAAEKSAATKRDFAEKSLEGQRHTECLRTGKTFVPRIAAPRVVSKPTTPRLAPSTPEVATPTARA